MDASTFDALLPQESGVRIQQIDLGPAAVVVTLVTAAPSAACPRCGVGSASVHSHYHRLLRDRPCLGRPLHLSVTSRKFVCARPDCPQRVFCERLPGLAGPHARTSGGLAESHRAIGMALGGEAGARLAAELSVPTSPDTILRRVKGGPDEPSPPPRYVGIDDWACRKGQSYGTILIDLERRRVIDILPGRDGEALKKWLAANPQVEVITRDRWPAYIEAATAAAPQAKQVADRFHLLRNVREAVEKLLSRHGPAIRAAGAEVDTPPAEADPAGHGNASPAAAPPEPPSESEKRRAEKRRRREERFRQVKELTAQGHSCRSVARRLGMGVKAVLRYRRLDRCPDWNPGRLPPTQLDPFAAFIADWVAAGNRNSADLYRLLKSCDYRGGYDAVRRYLNRLIGSSGRPGRRGREARPRQRSAPSARKLSFRVANPKPESRSTRVLSRLRGSHPGLHAALGLAEELMAMIRRSSTTTLREWAAKAEASGEADLKNLAASLLQDAAAVEAAMTESWSNGQVEGQVNRLKLIKRSMFGRAGMKLLRARVRHKG
jgi:transposase